jgi:hypothetical protein
MRKTPVYLIVEATARRIGGGKPFSQNEANSNVSAKTHHEGGIQNEQQLRGIQRCN